MRQEAHDDKHGPELLGEDAGETWGQPGLKAAAGTNGSRDAVHVFFGPMQLLYPETGGATLTFT